jgi:NADH-quinone oxidoreductase subunit N
MNELNVSLLRPELSLVGLAIGVILLDLFVKKKGLVALLALAGLAAPLAFSILLIDHRGEVGFYNSLAVDNFGLFFKFLTLGVAALVILGSQDYVSKFRHFQGEFYALLLLCSAGMMLLAATTDLIAIYVSLELTSLSLAAMATFLRDGPSTEAGIKFLVLSAISSAIMLYGMALIFGLTGSTKLDDIAIALPDVRIFDNPALLLGIIFMIAGFGFKISTVPFQMWVPDVYQGAPTPVVAFLSVASKAAGFAVLIRVFYVAFVNLDVDWKAIFAVLAVASMFIGNLVAINQNNIKRMLGYSTIAHAGYILIGVAAITGRNADSVALGPSSALFYLAAYAVTNLAAFFAIIAISNKTNSDEIEDYSGLAQRNPWLAFAMVVAMVSLTGIPPTALFWAKLYIFNAAIQSDLAWLAIIGVLNSVISAYYYLRVIKHMYVRPTADQTKFVPSIPMGFALTVVTLAVLVFGIWPTYLLQAANKAVSSMF